MDRAERMLGDLYVDKGSHLIEIDGRQVLGSLRLQLSKPAKITVNAKFAHADPQQGVVLGAKPRQLKVAEQRGKMVVLWDYAPFPVEAELIARKGPFVVTVYNVWKGPRETTMAWIANGGMVIRDFTDKHLILDCNAGPRDVTFTDATVTISWPDDVTVSLLLPGEKPATELHAR